MPLNFKPEFANTRVVIDASEFFIGMPRNKNEQYMTFSQYKSHNTYTVLFGLEHLGSRIVCITYTRRIEKFKIPLYKNMFIMVSYTHKKKKKKQKKQNKTKQNKTKKKHTHTRKKTNKQTQKQKQKTNKLKLDHHYFLHMNPSSRMPPRAKQVQQFHTGESPKIFLTE